MINFFVVVNEKNQDVIYCDVEQAFCHDYINDSIDNSNGWAVKPAIVVTPDGEQATEKKEPVSRLIKNERQLKAMPVDALIDIQNIHTTEIAKLRELMVISEDQDWQVKAAVALKYLKLHQYWIEKEIKRKGLKFKLEQKKLAAEKNRDNEIKKVELSAKLKAKRMQISNEREAKEAPFFKKLVKELIGVDEYVRLWELAREMAGNSHD
jgi:hypothetical protein